MESEIDLPKTLVERSSWWVQEALLLNTEIQLDEAVVSESVTIVANAVGPQWLEAQLSQTKRSTFPESSIHQIAQWLEAPGPFQVCSIVELARYLKRLYDRPGFSEVTMMLRDRGSFGSVFLQLAHAFRFAEMGVSDLAFEPIVEAGRRGDILFVDQGTTFLCECFVPQVPRDKAFDEIFRQTSKASFTQASRLGKRVIVFANLEALGKVDQKKFQLVKTACLTAIECVENDSPLILDVSGCRIEVHDTSKMDNAAEEKLFQNLYNLSTSGVTARLVNKSSLKDIRRGLEVPDELGSRFLVRAPKSSGVAETILSLAEKVSRKTAQVRPTTGYARGIMIVESPLGRPDNQFVDDSHRESLRKRILDRYEHVAAVLFADRVLNDAKRTMYCGYFMFRHSDLHMRDIISRLQAVETKFRHLE